MTNTIKVELDLTNPELFELSNALGQFEEFLRASEHRNLQAGNDDLAEGYRIRKNRVGGILKRVYPLLPR